MKYMKKTIVGVALCCLTFTILSVATSAQNSELKDATDSPYKVGQLWSYKTRANESKSTFIVVKVDNHPTYGNIVHIAVRDLKMKNPNSPNGISDKINHSPFSERAVAQSAVTMLKEKVELPDFEPGYRLWREAFDQKRAGFYEVSIAEAVDTTEQGLNQ